MPTTEHQRAQASFVGEKIETAAHNLAGAARDFKNHPTLEGFGRVVGGAIAIVTIVKGYQKAMREMLGKMK